MLQTVLGEVVQLRDGAAADRAALAQALNASFEGLEHQLNDLRTALQEVAAGAAQDSAETKAHTVERSDALAVDITALRSDLNELAKTVGDATSRISNELHQLRTALLGGQ